MRLENWTSSLDSVENEGGRKKEPRQIKLIHLFQPRGEGADYAHYITTCPSAPGVIDHPTALQKLLREERRKNLGKLHWFISKWPTFIFMYMRDFIRTTTRKLEWNLTFPHRSAVMLRLPRVLNLPTSFWVHQVLGSCGFQWCSFRWCAFSKNSPNIHLMRFSLHKWWNLFL